MKCIKYLNIEHMRILRVGYSTIKPLMMSFQIKGLDSEAGNEIPSLDLVDTTHYASIAKPPHLIPCHH